MRGSSPSRLPIDDGKRASFSPIPNSGRRVRITERAQMILKGFRVRHRLR
jgi:hypothetical protein